MSGLGPLNLSDADTRGFDAVDAGRYNAEVFDVSIDAVKNTDGTGKMPAGTPMLKIQYKLLSDSDGNSEGIANRRVFQTLVFPPADYDPSKASKMKGMIVRWFVALGEDEKTVMSKKYDPDYEDFRGRSCVVVVGKEPKKDRQGNIIDGEWNNPVKGVKPAGSAVATAPGGLL